MRKKNVVIRVNSQESSAKDFKSFQIRIKDPHAYNDE